MSLPPVDPMRNREVLAERLKWPEGALAACLALEKEFPHWWVCWTAGNLKTEPFRGYQAQARVHNYRFQARGEHPADLRAQLQYAETVRAARERDLGAPPFSAPG